MNFRVTACVLTSLALPVYTSAEIVFSTIPVGVTDTTNANWGYEVGGLRAQRFGYRFVPSISGSIFQIDSWAFAGAPRTARFELYNEIGGVPGTLLASLPVVLPQYPGIPQPRPIVPTPVYPVTNFPSLNEGEAYFLVIAPTGTTIVTWLGMVNTLGITPMTCYRDVSTPWGVAQDSSILLGLTIHVPSPAAAPMLILLGYAASRRQRTKA